MPDPGPFTVYDVQSAEVENTRQPRLSRIIFLSLIFLIISASILVHMK